MVYKNILLLLLLGILCVPAYADDHNDKDIEINVHLDGDDVLVDVSFTVLASAHQVWDVLTDFDHMASFISNLQSSKITGRSCTVVQVSQKGVAKYAMMTFPFETAREMRLIPYEKILSHMVSGTMRKMEGETQLIDDGNQTRVVYHADAIPGLWIPPFLGIVFIEHETREQFREMRNEILRRKQAETKQARANVIHILPAGRSARWLHKVQPAYVREETGIAISIPSCIQILAALASSVLSSAYYTPAGKPPCRLAISLNATWYRYQSLLNQPGQKCLFGMSTI